jgi:beta-lactam-binding protein with PASTA domain/serine/threonine protein kinase
VEDIVVDRTVADPMIGRLLDGRYRVGPRIARGGMATVYEATDLRLERVVALKIMHSGLGDDDEFAGRFVREARSAARLSHPNVVSVFDQGDDDGTLFLAMEYIPGHTLRDLIRKEAPMAPPKAFAMLEPVLSALAAAHEAGLVHRDVKPENVLLADDGRVKVADFGLARAVSAETQHTGTSGVLIGTVSYLAPELVIDGRADARSDVYAAGVLLYEMLTGRKPHEGESPIQVAYKHVHEDVPPPSHSIEGLPAYVDALVARATSRDRGHRPADARVLLHQVRRVRQALDHGITEDQELTEDLTPTTPVGIGSFDRDGHHEGTMVVDRTTLSGATVLPDARPSNPNRPPRHPADAGPARAPRRSRRGPVLLALVLVLAVVAGYAGWYYGMGRYVVTPGVINLSQTQAREKVEAAGLGFEVRGREYSETVTAGSVISTDPAAGSNILQDGTVAAIVSRGPERYDVPRLRGMTEDQAQEALEKANLTFGETTERFHENVAAGVVLSSNPEDGTELKPDAAVDLVVSKGPKPLKVPDLTGKSAERAEQVLTERGFEVEVDRENHDTVPDGEVISQSPSSGTLFRGETVRLVVSEGPVMVEVPDVRGVGVDEARRILEEGGFEVRTENSDLYVGLEFVVETDPEHGSLAPDGSVVTLYLV